MDPIEELAALEQADSLHEARLLVLLLGFIGSSGEGKVEGLTKLAKLDFFLRYPVMLQKALVARNCSTRAVRLQPYEESCVESKMVRYRFGPWDHRYRRFLNLLVAKRLVEISVRGRTINIGLTSLGVETATRLAASEHFEDVRRRARALNTHLNLSATNLMKFVYSTFPEISSLRMNEYIES